MATVKRHDLGFRCIKFFALASVWWLAGAGLHWSKSQQNQTIITEVVVICVRARYTLCHDMCHVCMMDSISNLLLIVDY